jgi:ATP/ADP translocase
VGSLAAGCLDYIFKAQATTAMGSGEDLLRFFAVFYTAAALLSFLIQAGIAQRMLERTGLTRTAAMLPAGVVFGAATTLAAPGLAAATLARGVESSLRNSLYRSGYEPLYIPLPPAQRRASKQFIDVGFERVGDAMSGGLIRVVLWSVPAISLQLLGVAALALGILGIWITRRVHRGWVGALARSLESQAARMELQEHDQATQTMIFRTLQESQMLSP